MYQLNEAKMFADIAEGTAIVINSLSGIYYGMNAFGTCVFDNLISGSSPEDIVKETKKLPGSPVDLEEKVSAFIDTLIGYEIIIPVEEVASRMAVIDSAAAEADAFVPECKEYKDVQELLFADPIHDVDEDEGWKPE